MPNFNDYKTGNLAWWGEAGGITAWKLLSPINVWNWLMDYLAGLDARVGSFAAIPVVANDVTPGASPYTYTAGTTPETLYISGDAVITAITRHGTALTDSAVTPVLLEPGGQVTIAYSSGTPKLVSVTGGISNNVAGVTAVLTPGPSPYTYTASNGRMEVIYISGDSISAIKCNGVQLADTVVSPVILPRGGSVEVTYGGVAPRMVSDS